MSGYAWSSHAQKKTAVLPYNLLGRRRFFLFFFFVQINLTDAGSFLMIFGVDENQQFANSSSGSLGALEQTSPGRDIAQERCLPVVVSVLVDRKYRPKRWFTVSDQHLECHGSVLMAGPLGVSSPRES